MKHLPQFTRLLFIAFAVCICNGLYAQKFEINAVHCSMSKDNLATMNKIGKFEGHFYNVIFNTEKNDTLSIKINLYGRAGEYKDVQKEAMNTTFINGFYSVNKNQIYLYKRDEYMNTLLHETSHALLWNNLKNPPRWLNEGIATVFGRMVITDKDEVLYVKQTHYIKFVKEMIRNRTFDLQEFLREDVKGWYDAEKREYLYSVAYTLVYFFVENNVPDLQRYLLLLKEGNSSAAAIKKLYGGFPQFENKFLDFCSAQSAYSNE